MDNSLVTYSKKSVFWLTKDAIKLGHFDLLSTINKLRHDSYLYVHGNDHVAIFEHDRYILLVNRAFDKVILKDKLLYCFDEQMQILHIRQLSKKDTQVIPYQRYAVNDKFVCLFNKNCIIWLSLAQMKTIATLTITDSIPHALPSFLLNIALIHPSYPLLLVLSYESLIILDCMNTIQYEVSIKCPVQSYFLCQDSLFVYITNTLNCVNIITMEPVKLPFQSFSPSACKTVHKDAFIACFFTSNVIIYDLVTFKSYSFSLLKPMKDVCADNIQLYYVDGSDKVYHLYCINDEWLQDSERIQDWTLSKIKIIDLNMYLGTMTEWFIYNQ